MEAAGLGIFMISACVFGTLLAHPSSPFFRWLLDYPMLQRVLMGLAMGSTAIAMIHSPWGKQSGAHLNPSVTLTYFRLGKVRLPDAVFYILAQFAGGTIGVCLVAGLIGRWLADPAVRYVATVPGPSGASAAFAAEMVISFILMLMVLTTSNSVHLAKFTGVFAGALVATYIVFESPISGMSMNPARTLASALPAKLWTFLWLYFTAPPFGMLLAAEIYVRLRGARAVICAKLHHRNRMRCIFSCGYGQERTP